LKDFLQFVPMYSITGQNLATINLDTLKNLGMNCDCTLGTSYDDAIAMSGNFKGI